MTLDEVVAELSDGMTLGIGGWGSRRKPMALVRAITRSSLTDLVVVRSEERRVGKEGRSRRSPYH